jgi:hypothetical protein
LTISVDLYAKLISGAVDLGRRKPRGFRLAPHIKESRGERLTTTIQLHLLLFAFSTSRLHLTILIFDMLSLTILTSMLLGASAVAAKPMQKKPMHHGKCHVSKVDVSATFPSGQTQLHGQMHGPDFIGETFVDHSSPTLNAQSRCRARRGRPELHLHPGCIHVGDKLPSMPHPILILDVSLVGAVAQIFDISCLHDKPIFADVAVVAFDAWSEASESMTAQELKSLDLPFKSLGNMVLDEKSHLGLHFFVKNDSAITGIPAWDFATSQHNPQAFVDVAAFEKLPAPRNVTDVPWLQVRGTKGKLATSVYRLFTRGGQPPAMCGPKDPQEISVKYTSQYCTSFSSTMLLDPADRNMPIGFFGASF